MEFAHFSLVILFATRLVNSTVEHRECTPSEDVNCSFLFGYGRFEEIVKDSAEDISTSASINCQIEGKEDLLKVEWILFGEPPRTIEFEADIEVLSALHGLTLTCIVSDIPRINRAPPPSAEQPYQVGIGNVTYNCEGSENLSVKFVDMRMLSRDLRRITGGLGAGNGLKCVSESKMPEGKTSDQLGQACAGSLRRMYDETGQFVCEQCCANHYWSKEYRRGQCRECSACFSNNIPNIWTSCKTVKDCTLTSTAPSSSSSPNHSRTSTASSSTPYVSRPALTPPSLSPQNVKIIYRNQTYADVKWDVMASSPVDQYIVTTSINEPHMNKSWDTLTSSTAVAILDLSPYTSYAVTICGSNKAGRGPWSNPVHFKTLGVRPRHPPTNVVVSLHQDRVNITWDPIVGQQTGDEDPILGVKVYFRALQNVSDNGIRLDSHKQSLEFLLKEYGTYEILVYSYNEAGESPAEERTVDYMEEEHTAQSTSGWADFGYSVPLMAGKILIFWVCSRYLNKEESHHPVPRME